jgi:hypothetical protein
VEPCLPQDLALVLKPVVVPVGQQIADEVGQVHRVQIDGVCLVEATRERREVPDINLDVGIEPEQ